MVDKTGCILAKIRQTNSEDIQVFMFIVENEDNIQKWKYTFDKACHKLSISLSAFMLFPDEAVNLQINYKVAKIAFYN